MLGPWYYLFNVNHYYHNFCTSMITSFPIPSIPLLLSRHAICSISLTVLIFHFIPFSFSPYSIFIFLIRSLPLNAHLSNCLSFSVTYRCHYLSLCLSLLSHVSQFWQMRSRWCRLSLSLSLSLSLVLKWGSNEKGERRIFRPERLINPLPFFQSRNK